MIDKNISKRGPEKRDTASYETLHDIIIPAGTILRAAKDDKYIAPVGSTGEFSIIAKFGVDTPGFRRVVAG